MTSYQKEDDETRLTNSGTICSKGHATGTATGNGTAREENAVGVKVRLLASDR